MTPETSIYSANDFAAVVLDEYASGGQTFADELARLNRGKWFTVEDAERVTEEFTPERQLALSVLVRALDDIYTFYGGGKVLKALGGDKNREEAVRWCVEERAEVLFWCEMACVEPGRFYGAVRRRLEAAGALTQELSQALRGRKSRLAGAKAPRLLEEDCAAPSYRGRVMV